MRGKPPVKGCTLVTSGPDLEPARFQRSENANALKRIMRTVEERQVHLAPSGKSATQLPLESHRTP